MAQSTQALPPEITVFERGWLSSNNVLFTGARSGAALVDTGYCTHGAQTVALVRAALGERPLERILNTHLHSDHCGGNAALQTAWPTVHTAIPPGQAAHVRQWDPYQLSYTPTGQECPPFRCDAVLMPGSEVVLGDRPWQVHAAPGHDPHSIILFEPQDGILISADALWENGFGVVFPELEGTDAFDEVARTLDVIERLEPRTIIPGHGPVFGAASGVASGAVPRALATARKRLDGFVQQPLKHARYAAKVLLKYKLLEWQRISLPDLRAWTAATPYFAAMHARHFGDRSQGEWLSGLIDELVQSGAAQRDGDMLINL